MKIRITTVVGDRIDIDAPDDMNFLLFCGSVRESGRWLHPMAYIPHDKIVSIVQLGEGDAPPKVVAQKEILQ